MDDDDDDDNDADESLFGLGEWFEHLFTGIIVGYQPWLEKWFEQSQKV